MKGIKINRLEIRFKGIPQGNIRDSINGLGSELLVRLSKDEGLLKRRGVIRIDRIDSGAIQAHGEINYAGLRGIIADRIAGSIIPKTQDHKKEK
jgi:hypothetical protein